MKTYWEVEILLHAFFDLDTRRRPAALPPGERAPGTYWIGGSVSTSAVLDMVSKRKIPSPRRESNPDHPIVQPVASPYTDCAIAAL
jgi:hypothetical protein